MPDISMCLNDACPSADTCWRHVAPPNEDRQSYIMGEPDARGYCDHYWPAQEDTHAALDEAARIAQENGEYD